MCLTSKPRPSASCAGVFPPSRRLLRRPPTMRLPIRGTLRNFMMESTLPSSIIYALFPGFSSPPVGPGLLPCRALLSVPSACAAMPRKSVIASPTHVSDRSSLRRILLGVLVLTVTPVHAATDWLPDATHWNGKFRGIGNGGLGGGAIVNPGGLANALRDGYASAGNNTGHEGGSDYAIGHPEKIKDFGYRSSHEMMAFSKALIAADYDSPLKYSLMAEAGGGTIAALSAAQLYPEDYDLLAVTSISSYLSHHTFGQMWIWYAGQAPNQLVVSHYKDGKQVGERLVCQYPQIAFYKGSGNTESPESFECR